jgi:hypothetical protein
MVALHNQPQGGLAMRRAPTEVRVARGNAGGYYGFTRWLGGQYYDQRQGSLTNNMAESQRRPLALTKWPLDERTLPALAGIVCRRAARRPS